MLLSRTFGTNHAHHEHVYGSMDFSPIPIIIAHHMRYISSYGLLPKFLFLELTLIRFSLRTASCGKYLAGAYHDERFGSDFSKVSTVSSAVPFFFSLGFHLCPFHIKRNTHQAGSP